MAKNEAFVNPAMLLWTRQQAGFPLDLVASSLKVPPEKVAEWESGVSRPPLGKAESLAKLFKRSLSFFYLDSPPSENEPGVDFRSGPRQPVAKTPQLQGWIRKIADRRARAVEVARSLGLDFEHSVPEADLHEDAEAVAVRLLAALQLRSQRGTQSSTDKYKMWREAIEAVGVFVFQIPASAQLDAACISGFSLGEFPFPVIAVNRGIQYNSRRLFTLVHEFVHLMLRNSGICDMEDPYQLPPQARKLEVFCNAVAGEALVPLRELKACPVYQRHPQGETDWSTHELKALAQEFGVSQEVILRRLLKMGQTTQQFYAAWRQRQIPPPDAKEEDETKEIRIPGHVQTLMSVGKPYARLMLLARDYELLNTADVCFCLGAKLNHLSKLEESVF